KYESECLGIYKYSQTNRFKFMIGVPVHMFGNQEVDFINYTIPATTYAVFSAYRPITQSVQSIWDYIYGIWLQNSEYTRGVGDDFEYYFLRQGELFADVYIPVEKA
nr:GyrI-like domain-containing protein [Vallitaleaceae bacterium]